MPPIFHQLFKKNYYQPKIIFSVTCLLVFALLLRLHHLDFESLYMDELRQISYYPYSFSDIVSLAASQQQPPLDYWIGHLIYTISQSDYSVRLPAAIFGTGMIFFLALFISRYCSWTVAICFGMITALLPYHLYYSQEARPYAIAFVFLIAFIWSLDRLIALPKRDIQSICLFFIFSTGLLFSRTLSPLVTVVVVLIMLCCWLIFLIIRDGFFPVGIQDRLLVAIVTIIISLLLYLPYLSEILAKGSRYTIQEASKIDMDIILSGLKSFSLIPLWKAYVVQTEPLTIPLAVLIILSPILILRFRRNEFGLIMILILLPSVAITNILIFSLKSNLPFRPSYAIYTLPFSIVLAAASFDIIREQAGKIGKSHQIQIILTVTMTIFIVFAMISMLDFKLMRKKTDWRGLSTYLMATYDQNNVLIFDSLSDYGNWEPTFYGFPRYYRGDSYLLPLSEIPLAASYMVDSQLRPVVILFQWRELYLTESSKYPLFPLSEAMKNIDYSRIASDPSLIVNEFVGFSVIELNAPASNMAEFALKIFDRLLANLPDALSVIEIQVAKNSLIKALSIGR